MLKSSRSRWIIVAGLLTAFALLAWRPLRIFQLNQQAQEALRDGDPDAAQVFLQQSLSLNPRSGFSNFLMARTARRQGRAAEVVKYIDQARQAGFPAKTLDHELLLVLAQSGRIEQVEPHIPELLPRNARDGAEVTAAIVAGYAHNYRFQEAFGYLDAWEADYPDDPEPHVMRGKLLQRWHDPHGAELEFRKALQLRPRYRGVRELLALTLVEQNEHEAAATLIAEALRVDPGSERLRIAWAECLLRLGRVDEAATEFQALAQRLPDDCDILAGLGSLAFLSGDLEEARTRLERVRTLCPERADTRYKLAQTLQKLGHDAEADGEFKFVRDSGKALSRVHDLAESLVQNPEDLAARVEIGKTLLEFGDRADGALWLETIFEFVPEHPEAHRLLADYYERAGDSQRAATHRAAIEQSAAPGP